MSAVATTFAFLAPLVAFKPREVETQEQKSAPDPRSIDGLIAWLETKEPDETFDYWDYDNCVFAQYAKQRLASFYPGYSGWYYVACDVFDNTTRAELSVDQTTFGGVLEAARAFRQSGAV